jgi:cathepsin D
LPIESLTVQGNSVSLPSGSDSRAAIDTGTTLVGGPSSVISEFYSNIDGATAGTGNYDGYYLYRELFIRQGYTDSVTNVTNKLAIPT